MADNPEFTAAVEKETQEVIGRLINEQDWEEEEKQNIQKEYMKEFDGVMQELLPVMISLSMGSKPTIANTNDDDGEALENAKVRYEATVIAIAKRRTKYPETLSKLLGKTNRLKKETAAVMKMDVQLQVPVTEATEGAVTTDLDNTYFDILKEEVNEGLLDSTHKILMDVERLSSLVDFAKVARQMDPLSSLFDDYNTYRASNSS